MPARPVSDATLQLIAAVRTALEGRNDVEERQLFGSHCFMVDGKLCLGIKHEELLVRLPPEGHAAYAEHTGVRELSPEGKMPGYFWVEPAGYATGAQWRFWLDQALAYNPRALASKPRSGKASARRPSVFAPSDVPHDKE